MFQLSMHYLDEAADGLLLPCERTTWCWAAHESFATGRQEVLAGPAELELDPPPSPEDRGH